MLATLLYKFSLFLLGFNLLLFTRYAFHAISVKNILHHLPGPEPSSTLFGEEWELYCTTPGSRYVEWHSAFGKVLKFKGAFGHKVVSITDPKAISFILGEGAYVFPKPRGVRAWFHALLGEGVLWIEGKADHQFQRRLLSPAFNPQSVRQLTDIFFETSTRLADQWNKAIEENHGQETQIEVTDWAGRFSLDTVGRATFSYDFECLLGEPHELAETLDGLTNSEHKLSSFYMRALFWIFPAVLKVGKKGEMIRAVKSQLGAIGSKMWKDAKIACDTETKSVLSVMLKTVDSSPISFEEEAIISQLRTIISAGYETVSAIIAWLLYELAIHPEIQDDLRDEICAISDPSFDDFTNRLPLLDAVVKETLRLHPAILENHHEAAETIAIPLSDPLMEANSQQLVIPKGTLVVIPVNVLQTDPEIWGDDAHLFRPSRWLDSKDVIRGRGLLAFSMGPRSCIGKTFAITEIKCLMVILLQRFSFRCHHKIEPFQSFVIRPRIAGQTSSSLPLEVKKV